MSDELWEDPKFVFDRPRAMISELAARHHYLFHTLRTAEDVAEQFKAKLIFHHSPVVGAHFGKRPIELFLPINYSARQDRFHALEAISFRMLHPELRVVNERTGEMIREEALWFAIGALMPQEAFEAAMVRTCGERMKMVEHFGVSEQMIEARAKSLRLEHHLLGSPPGSSLRL